MMRKLCSLVNVYVDLYSMGNGMQSFIACSAHRGTALYHSIEAGMGEVDIQYGCS